MGYEGHLTSGSAAAAAPGLINLAAFTINAEATVWTPAAGKRFRLRGGLIAVDVAGAVTFKDNTGGTTIIVVPTLSANVAVPFTVGHDSANGWLSAAANNVLRAVGAGAAAKITGYLYGTEE